MAYNYCMRISDRSRDDTRDRWKHYKKKSGGADDFVSNVVFLEDIFLVLREDNKLPQTTEDEVVAYIDRVCETKGEPLKPGAPWEPVNVRGPYQNTIPGMISEMIAPHNLYSTLRDITHPQDEQTQRYDEIDVFANTLSVQIKSVQCEGSKLLIRPKWLGGKATHLSLVDIDDQDHWFVPRKLLIPYSGTYITKRELVSLCTKYYDNDNKYPRRG